MYWHISHRCDPRARKLADRHYNRQSIGAANFVPPGRCLVLVTEPADAFWVTSWPFAEYVRHEWAGAWVCSAFRNESALLSSELIVQAVAVTCWHYGTPPQLGMITFVDPTKVQGAKYGTAAQRARHWGYCYRKAGFQHVGYTKGGLIALQLKPHDMPTPQPAMDMQLDLFA